MTKQGCWARSAKSSVKQAKVSACLQDSVGWIVTELDCREERCKECREEEHSNVS